jgi:hypothetical protein
LTVEPLLLQKLMQEQFVSDGELNYPGTNGIETSYPFRSMTWSLRFGTPTDDIFKVKESMSYDIEGRWVYTDAYCKIKASTKSNKKYHEYTN